MNVEPVAGGERDVALENLAAELTDAAYRVALQHGVGAKWLELQLDLWAALRQTIQDRTP
jgi:hypothetical protein